MTQTEIKKAIYKEKPIAKRTKLDHGYHYIALLSTQAVEFFIPFKEMGMTPFDAEMPSQLLIRWIQS